MTACPTPDQLQQLLDETLAADEFRAIETHVETCAACQKRLDTLTEAAAGAWPPVAVNSGASWLGPTRSAVLYQPVRLHAQGGLGEVFEVRDEQLQRPVALKVLKERYSNDPDLCRLFLREAEITAHLEHPGIVPVHTQAPAGEGRPWYVMRLVQGQTLHEAIRAFHDAERAERDPGKRQLALRQLLSRFLAVCNTVAYAHSRGVLHRDLKPANIMLGPYGETLVLDWGLAKRFSGDEADARDNGKEEAPTGSGEEVSCLMSRAGGTPGFMSPEQAAGAGMAVGPASDIYSLGATLYCLLTGQAPAPAAGDLPPPSRINRQAPRALEAICLKAMAPHPADRHGTVLALAADIEHWLADEPVSARRESWWERGRRWVKRHQGWAAAGVAAVLVTLAAVTVAAALLRTAYGDERQARELAEHQRARADGNLDRALAVMDYFLQQVRHDPKAVLWSREEILTYHLPTLVDFYQQLLADQSAPDARGRRLLGRAYSGLGVSFSVRGERAHAEASFLRAQGFQEALTNEFPDQLDHAVDLATTLGDLGKLYLSEDRRNEADAAQQKLAMLLDSLRADPLRAHDFTSKLAKQLYFLGRVDEVPAWLGKGIDILEAVPRDDPRYPEVRVRLLGSFEARAFSCWGQQRYAQAVQDWDRLQKLEPAALSLTARAVRACCLAQVGKVGRATAEAETVWADSGISDGDRVRVACIYALCVAATQGDASLEPAVRAQRVEQYAARALAILTQLRDAGYFKTPANREDFKQLPDFDSLKMRDDFKQFLADLDRNGD
jgi:tetratricopeptide (TPR) repeat protein